MAFLALEVLGWVDGAKAFWHLSFHAWGLFFLKNLKMGLQVEVILAMNRLIYCSWPRNPLISFSLLGGGISNMALIFGGSTLIPLSLTKKPNNFPTVTPNVHFCRFSLSLNSLIFSKNFLKLMMWPLSILGFYNYVNNMWPLIMHHVMLQSCGHSWAQMALLCCNRSFIPWWR